MTNFPYKTLIVCSLIAFVFFVKCQINRDNAAMVQKAIQSGTGVTLEMR